jgi:hypothetical protein
MTRAWLNSLTEGRAKGVLRASASHCSNYGGKLRRILTAHKRLL